MLSIQKITEGYIQEHPSIKDCLKNGMINYSSLSRRIASEMNLRKKDFDAILIACRRFRRKLRKEEDFEARILRILRQSRIEVKNKVVAVVLEKGFHPSSLLNLQKEMKRKDEIFRIIESISAVTIITAVEFLELVRKYFRGCIILENMGLAEITIKSPKEIENTPGAYAYLCSLFGDNNINIVETLSCYTDTIFLVKEEYIGKAMGLLRF